MCEALLFLWYAHGGAHCKTAAHDPRATRMFLHWRGAIEEGRIGTTGILPVAATPGSYPLAHRRLSRRRPRGSAALPLEALPSASRGAVLQCAPSAHVARRKSYVLHHQKNGCEPCAAATRKMRVCPSAARPVAAPYHAVATSCDPPCFTSPRGRAVAR